MSVSGSRYVDRDSGEVALRGFVEKGVDQSVGVLRCA